MLSVLVYGRNDAYGENYHRRAALSLNCIAELLTESSDEIVFVDYATPNTLPTLIEAISDTLTPKAAQLLRVIRVRPEYHERIAGARASALPVLEAIARNIGLRRIREGQTWVLSTNTDMVFIPKFEGLDFASILSQLRKGPFHLKRFEVPETLWHTMRRSDPAAAVADLTEFSGILGLDQFSVAHEGLLFDNPGDFQLAPADILQEIGGFNEAMHSGWHIDANLSARLNLRYGEIGNASSFLKGFHLSHTRTATPKHMSSAAEDDYRKYVTDVTEASLPEQELDWGGAGFDFEEFTLAQSPTAHFVHSLYVSRMEHRSDTGLLDERNRLWIDKSPEPYLALNLMNLLHHASPTAKIGLCVASGNVQDAFQEIAGLSFGNADIYVPAEFDSGQRSEIGGARVYAVSRADFVKLPDFFVLSAAEEFKGAAAHSSISAKRKFLSILEELVAAERDRLQGGAAARAILAHGMAGRLDEYLRGEIDYSTTPNVVGVKIGQVRSHAVSRSASDQCFLEGLIARLCAGDEPSQEDRKLAAGLQTRIVDCLDNAEAAGRPLASSAQRAAILTLAQAGRASAGSMPLQTNGSLSGRRGLRSRLASTLDWSMTDWRAVAMNRFGGRERTRLDRFDPWVWERASVLVTARDMGLLAAGKSTLLIVHMPEIAAYGLAQNGAEVSVIDPVTLLDPGYVGQDWRHKYANDELVDTSRVTHLADAAGAAAAYDAVIILQSGAFIRGAAGFARLLKFAAARLKPDGALIFSANVKIGEPSAANRLPAALLGSSSALEQALTRHTPFTFSGPTDFSLDRQSLDTLAWMNNPANSSASDGSRLTSIFDSAARGLTVMGVFALQKTGAGDVNAPALTGDLQRQWGKGPGIAAYPPLQRIASRLKTAAGWKSGARAK